MAAPRFIQVSPTGPGLLEVIAATAGGVLSADKIPTLDASGLLAASMMPIGIGADTQTLIASEALSSGDLVNVWNNAGTASARKANAATGLQADGFILASAAAAATTIVYFEGNNTQLVGLTIGAAYYLGAAGAVTATIPATSGITRQYVGVATSATTLNFEPGTTVLIA